MPFPSFSKSGCYPEGDEDLTGIMCIIGGRGTSVKLDRENVLVLFLDSLQEKSYYLFNKLQRVLVWNKKSRRALDAYAAFLLPRPGRLHLISVK